MSAQHYHIKLIDGTVKNSVITSLNNLGITTIQQWVSFPTLLGVELEDAHIPYVKAIMGIKRLSKIPIFLSTEQLI